MEEAIDEIIGKYIFWALVIVAVKQYGMPYFYKVVWWIYKLINKKHIEKS